MHLQVAGFTKSAGIFALGMIVGIFSAAYGLSYVFARVQDDRYDRGYVGAASEGATFLRLLKDMDNHEADKVDRALNSFVDNYTLILGNYAAVNKESDSNRFVYTTLASIRQYRHDHPSQATDAAFRLRVEKALGNQ